MLVPAGAGQCSPPLFLWKRPSLSSPAFCPFFCPFSHFLAAQSSSVFGVFVPLDFWHFLAFNRLSCVLSRTAHLFDTRSCSGASVTYFVLGCTILGTTCTAEAWSKSGPC